MKTFVSAALCLLVGLSVTLCGVAHAQQKPITIGVISSMAGPAGRLGIEAVRAAELVRDAVVAKGGLRLGGQRRQIVMTYYDHPALGAVMSDILSESSSGKTFLFVGPTQRARALAIASMRPTPRAMLVLPVADRRSFQQQTDNIAVLTFLDETELSERLRKGLPSEAELLLTSWRPLRDSRDEWFGSTTQLRNAYAQRFKSPMTLQAALYVAGLETMIGALQKAGTDDLKSVINAFGDLRLDCGIGPIWRTKKPPEGINVLKLVELKDKNAKQTKQCSCKACDWPSGCATGINCYTYTWSAEDCTKKESFCC